MDDDQLLYRIKEALSERTDASIDEMGLHTRLLEDLVLSGNDGVEYLDEYRRRYGVDLTGLPAARYLGKERGILAAAVLFFLYPILEPWRLLKARLLLAHPVTIADLMTWAKDGKWSPPTPDNVDAFAHIEKVDYRRRYWKTDIKSLVILLVVWAVFWGFMIFVAEEHEIGW